MEPMYWTRNKPTEAGFWWGRWNNGTKSKAKVRAYSVHYLPGMRKRTSRYGQECFMRAMRCADA